MDILKNAPVLQEATRVMIALDSPVRQQILALLIEHGELTVGSMVTLTAQSYSNISNHLNVLYENALVDYRAIKTPRAGQQPISYFTDESILQSAIRCAEILCSIRWQRKKAADGKAKRRKT